MTVNEALLQLSNYPIPDKTIEKYIVVRGLISGDLFDSVMAESEAYKLVEADIYNWLYTSPDLVEQEINFTQPERDNFLRLANSSYALYDDSKYTGTNFGFVGEDFNG